MNFPKTTFKFLFHFAHKQWVQFAVLIGTTVIWATNESFFPYFLKRIINGINQYHGAPEKIYAVLLPILILLGLFWLANEIAGRLQGAVMIYTFPKFRANIRASVFEYVKSHSHEYFASHFAGNLAKKLNDLPNACQTEMEIICLQFTTATVGALIVLTLMWLTKPIFAILIFCWLCIHLLISIGFIYKSNKLWEIHSDSHSTLNGKIVDVFTNILNVRLFSRSTYEKKYLSYYQKDEIQKAHRAMWCIEIMRTILGINGLLLIFGIIFTLIHGWIKGWVTIGDFTQIGMQTFWLLGWIWFISFQMTIFAREIGVITDSLALVKKSHDLIDVADAKSIVIHRGQIQFENVNFGYQKNRPVFQNLNLVISAGEKVGLVGFSGSGKSTFVNLILRFYDIQSGKILIDGVDIATVKQDSLREQIAMIPQDPTLFHRTLFENIRYGNISSTDEEVIRASKLAHCHEFIEKLEMNYHALVGERGIKLSGGQRQRIAIARAILKDAPILILDEATSSLDSVTEKLIQESLYELMKERTTIVVAHRLSTLSTMDRILVFHQGKLIEEGTKESLLKRNGHFSKLWNMQVNGFLPD